MAAQLVLGGFDEETTLVEFDVDCNEDIVLGYDWLHSLAFLYDTNEVRICAERDCSSGRRIRLDLTLDGPASRAIRLSLAEARAQLGAVGLGPTCMLGCPSQWYSMTGGSAAAAAIQAAAAIAGTEDTLAGLAETRTTLADRTELFVGRIAFAAEGTAFALPPDDGDPPVFAANPRAICARQGSNNKAALFSCTDVLLGPLHTSQSKKVPWSPNCMPDCLQIRAVRNQF